MYAHASMFLWFGKVNAYQSFRVFQSMALEWFHRNSLTRYSGIVCERLGRYSIIPEWLEYANYQCTPSQWAILNPSVTNLKFSWNSLVPQYKGDLRVLHKLQIKKISAAVNFVHSCMLHRSFRWRFSFICAIRADTLRLMYTLYI